MAYEDPQKKLDFNASQIARWKSSGLGIDTFLKTSGLAGEGYTYNAKKESFEHPDSYLANVDPNTIPSSIGRLRARAIQGLDRATSPTPVTATTAPNPYVPRGATAATGGPRSTGLTPEDNWRATFAPKQPETPGFWNIRQAQATTLLAPPVRTDAEGGRHVQIDPRYGGGEGSTRFLPATAPGYINGRQVEGTPGAPPYPNLIEYRKKELLGNSVL